VCAVQKFTRPLTREIELAGERLALTFDEAGLSLRPVGSRKPPRQLSWAALIYQLATSSDVTPAPEALAEAVRSLKGGSASKPSSRKPEAAATPTPVQEPGDAISKLWQRLESWLATHRKRYFEGLAPGATPAELEELQRALGMPLPAELSAWLKRHNGQSYDFTGSFVESWNLMTTRQIAGAKRELDAMATDTPSGWQKTWIPFLSDTQGDYVCLDTTESPPPVRELWVGQPEHRIVAPSLTAWFVRFVEEVERGEYNEDPERGLFLHKRE
jgi:cell wall assembly regulator SMI1